MLRRPLSARRPLAWSWWLPAMALGALLGQALGGAGAGGVAASAAVALAAPAVLTAHRAIGSALLLGSSAATLGALQVAWQDATRDARLALVGAPSSALRGRITSVKYNRGRGATRWAALEVVLLERSESLARGETVRLAVWRTERRWRIGEEVSFRAAPRAPRGFCNRGDDGYAGAAWRNGIVALASVANDAAVNVTASPAWWTDLHALVGASRDAISDAIAAAVPDPEQGSVLKALVIGDQSEIPPGLRRAYARTGTAHVLSVSGLHIALVAMTAFATLQWLLVRWPRLALRVLVARVAACGALLPAAFYAALSGGAVATLRALVMGAVGLGGIILLRRTEVWSALAAAALLLCALDAGVASDPSFQLSFASVAALVVAGRRSQAWCARRATSLYDPTSRIGRALVALTGAIVVSAAATVATAPITSFHFGSVAIAGVVANLVVVPLVGWLVLLLALAGAAVLPLSSALSQQLFWVAALALRPGNGFVEWLARRPWCAIDVALATPLQVIAVLALLAAFAVPRGRVRVLLLAVAAILSMVSVAEHLSALLRPSLEIHFLDVGQGDATIVELPGRGGAIVVDGGGLGGATDPGERVVVPSLRRAGISRLTAIALSHPEHDHYGGLAAVVRAVSVAELWSNGRGSPNAGFALLTDTLAEYGVTRRDLATGDRPLTAGAQGEVVVLHPKRSSAARSENDASLVLRLTFGATRVLLTGDVEAPAEATLLREGQPLNATIVKVPHHGSRTSSTRALVAASRPGLAVAMLGANNRFAFPAPEVRARYGGMGAAWRQTDRDGEVTVRSDGQMESVQTCRE